MSNYSFASLEFEKAGFRSPVLSGYQAASSGDSSGAAFVAARQGHLVAQQGHQLNPANRTKGGLPDQRAQMRNAMAAR
jgi:hypothetical protein